MTRPTLQCLALIAAALCGLALPSAAGQPQIAIADGFERPSLDTEIWTPFKTRPERHWIDRSHVRSGRGALAVHVAEADRDCKNTCQRNEIRIANNRRLTFGQEAWYGFSFRIDGHVPPGAPIRWVVGQWKEESDGSPFLAQRYSGGVFHITVQHNDCRVLVARSGSTREAFLSRLAARAFHEFPFVTNVKDYTCESGIEVTYGKNPILPDPKSGWVDMAYFVKGGRNGDGVIEVWAGGRFIARVTGSIGNDAVFGETQYFKIGMYRDPAPGAATLYFDSFRRGTSRTEVDPAQHVQ